jgi:hypothetical protein
MALQLRKKADGSLNLADGAEWPKVHHFSERWLLQQAVDGNVEFKGDDEIGLNLANSTATYTVTERLYDDWTCELKSSKAVKGGK